MCPAVWRRENRRRFSASMDCWISVPIPKSPGTAWGMEEGLKRPKWRIAPPELGWRTEVTSKTGEGSDSDSEDEDMVPVSEGWPPP